MQYMAEVAQQAWTLHTVFPLIEAEAQRQIP